jgi:hypothetical protein
MQPTKQVFGVRVRSISSCLSCGIKASPDLDRRVRRFVGEDRCPEVARVQLYNMNILLQSRQTLTKFHVYPDKPRKAHIGLVAIDTREGLLSSAPIHLRTPLLVADGANVVGFDARGHYLRWNMEQMERMSSRARSYLNRGMLVTSMRLACLLPQAEDHTSGHYANMTCCKRSFRL